MTTFFVVFLVTIIILTLIMLARLFKGPGLYNRFVGILVMTNTVILLLILIGFIDGRRDMYVDIAISYAVLGFISSVIVAKFLGGPKEDKDADH